MDLIANLISGNMDFGIVAIAGFIIVFVVLWLIGRKAYKNEEF